MTMDFFATFNPYYGRLPLVNSWMGSLRERTESKVLVLIVLLFFVICAACNLNHWHWLNEIERKKIYDRWDEDA